MPSWQIPSVPEAAANLCKALFVKLDTLSKERQDAVLSILAEHMRKKNASS